MFNKKIALVAIFKGNPRRNYPLFSQENFNIQHQEKWSNSKTQTPNKIISFWKGNLYFFREKLCYLLETFAVETSAVFCWELFMALCKLFTSALYFTFPLSRNLFALLLRECVWDNYNLFSFWACACLMQCRGSFWTVEASSCP